MNSPLDTIAAIATPLGEGGLGVIRVSGSQAIAVVDRFFKGRAALSDAATHTCHFGKLSSEIVRHTSNASMESGRAGIQMDPPLESAGEDDPKVVDQAIVSLFRAPNSYTGEDVVEISVHGSPYVLQEVLRLCFAQGARLAGPGEFTERAFLNGKIDLAQAEAVSDLIRAKTERAHGAALAQLEGHLSRRVRALRDRLLPLLAHIEVGLDHSDEAHDFLERGALLASCKGVRGEIETLLQSARAGKILREGLRVALCGRPNVGKSSLLNALLKEERAIVTPIAGTTRDTLEEQLDWAGLPVVITDTAGLRATAADAVEELGMARTRQAIGASDVVIGVFDGSQPLTDEDREIVRAGQERPHVWIANKSDLPARWTAQSLQQWNGGTPVLSVSARTGQGLEALVQAVSAHADVSTAAAAEWTLNVRHQDALRRADAALESAVTAAESDRYEECVAMELQTALAALGEIIGETTTEELLGEIFSTFCVGK